MLKAFSLKLWWRFREQSSLWATYTFRKYCHTTSPLSRSHPHNCSPTWRRLIRTWPLAQPHIRWVIGDGSALFWDDTWIGASPIRELCIDPRGAPLDRINNYWQNGHWDIAKLQLLHHQAGLPQDIIDNILDIPILEGEKDTPRWDLTTHGQFSVSSAWEIGRHRQLKVPLLDEIWNKGLTSSMSIFLWRLLSNRIPVDAKLQWRKIALASKCVCCSVRPQIESLHHLFISGRGAQEVWYFFDRWFPGTLLGIHQNDSVPDRMEKWGSRVKVVDNLHISRLIPGLAFWFIWAERNNSRHKKERFRANNIQWQILMHIRRLVFKGVIGPKQWRGCHPSVELGQPSGRSNPLLLPTVVKWQPPEVPWIKLNVACFLLNSAASALGGGILRDHEGSLIRAFVIPISSPTVIDAAIQTAIHGISVGQPLGQPVHVESDLVGLISLFNSNNLGPSNACTSMARLILVKRKTRTKASSVNAEGNKIAIALAKGTFGRDNTIWMDEDTVPHSLRTMVNRERRGFSNFGGFDIDPD